MKLDARSYLMKMTKWLVLAAGLALALPAAAEPLEQGDWEGSIGVAFLSSTDADFEGGTKASFDSDKGFRAAFDYSLTDALQVGGSFGWASATTRQTSSATAPRELPRQGRP